jgi:hypothetical protein
MVNNNKRHSFPAVKLALMAVLIFIGCFSYFSSTQAAPFGEQAWTYSGKGTLSATPIVSTSGMTFAYDASRLGYDGTWDYRTTSSDSGTVYFKWRYTGHHSWFRANASLMAYVNNPNGTRKETISLVNSGVIGSFTFSGTSSLHLSTGDTYGFLIAGDNFDSSQILTGSLEIEPLINVTADIAGEKNDAGWYNTDVSVSWTIEDPSDLPVISSSGCGPSTVTTDTEGETLTCSATTLSGTGIGSVTIKRDTAAPLTTYTAPITSGSHTVLTLSATDMLSGVSKTYYMVNGGAQQTGTEVELPSKGTYTVEFWSVDHAGNQEAHQTTIVSGIPSELKVEAAWDASTPKRDYVTVTVTTDGDIAQLKWLPGEQDTSAFASAGTDIAGGSFQVGENGTYTVFAQIMNGDSMVRVIEVMNIDRTPPTLVLPEPVSLLRGSSFAAPAAEAHDNYDSDALITVTSQSAVDTAQPGTYTVTYTAADRAGNTSTAALTVIVVDVDLTELSLGGIPLTFDSAQTAYALTAPDELRQTLLQYAATDSRVRVEVSVNGAAASGSPSGSGIAIALVNGVTTVEMKVYGAASEPLRTYTLTIHTRIHEKLNVEAAWDASTPKREYVTVTVTTNGDIAQLKWLPGEQDTSAFASAGTDIAGGSFQVSENGTYTAFAQNMNGDSMVCVIEVTSIDRTPPTLVLPEPVSLLRGSTFAAPDAEAHDNYDSDALITVTAQSAVDTAQPGTYTVTYTAADRAGNTSTAALAVIVVDVDLTELSLGGIPLTFDSAQTAYELTAPDELRQTLLQYAATDSRVRVEVSVNGVAASGTSPGSGIAIALVNGVTTVDVKVYGAASEPLRTYTLTIHTRIHEKLDVEAIWDASTPKRDYVTVTVTTDGDIAQLKWMPGEQDTSAFVSAGTDIAGGSFQVGENGTYTVFAQNMNGDSMVRVIEVTSIDRTPPTLVLPEPVSLLRGSSFETPAAEAHDNYDSDALITVTAQSAVDTAQPGTYTVTYTAADRAGNTSTAALAVIVVDVDLTELSVSGMPLTFDPAQTVYVLTAPDDLRQTLLHYAATDSRVRVEVSVNGAVYGMPSGSSIDIAVALQFGATPIELRLYGSEPTVVKAYLLTITKNPAPIGTPVPVTQDGKVVMEGGVQLQLGNASIGSEATIEVQEVTPELSDSGIAPAGKVYDFTLSGVDINPQQPVSLRLPIESGAEHANIGIFYWDEASRKWLYQPTSIQDGFAVADVTHFSIYGVFAAEQLMAPTVYPETGGVPVGTPLTLSAPASGAQIWYAIDGMEPTAASGSLYDELAKPVVPAGNFIIKAFARMDNKIDSPIVTWTYNGELSSSADLSGLAVNGVQVQGFSPAKLSYAVPVEYTTDQVTISATAYDSHAAVSIDGSAAAVKVVTLQVGSNPLSIEVTAQNGSKQQYTLNIERALPNNADLSSLLVNPEGIQFSPAVTSYSVTVSNSVYNVQLSAAAADPMAQLVMSANGQTVTGSVYLQVGVTNVQIIVTAQDGITKKTYNVAINRQGSSNADILSISYGASLLERTAGGFVLNVNYEVTGVALGVQLADPNASMSVTGATYSGMSVTGATYAASTLTFPKLAVGSNNAVITVTAQNGSTKPFEVTVNRLKQPSLTYSDLNKDGIVSIEDMMSWFTKMVDINLDDRIDVEDIRFQLKQIQPIMIKPN